MKKEYRIVYESYYANNPKRALERKEIMKDSIEKPTSLMDLSIGQEKQIMLVQKAQDCVLTEKIKHLSGKKECPCCCGELRKFGTNSSVFHDIFTDHQVKIQRLKCKDCGHEENSTVRTIFNGTESAELMKIQSEFGAKYTFREVESILNTMSGSRRQINNHDRVKQVVERVGGALEHMSVDEIDIICAESAPELILNVDGGHIKTTEESKRSIEAMTSVIYRPEALEPNDKGTRNYIRSKHCAASVKDDNQAQIITNTIVAALKEGLTDQTHVTALCDGAVNCWNVAEAIKPLSRSVTCILDWFHLGMKIKNISLPEEHKLKLIKIKWHLWRGNVERAQTRLVQLIDVVSESHKERLQKFLTYITNNKDKILDYRSRKKQGLVFTSNLAESTVESLVNQRCKQQQHMRWSRDGLNPLLQLRAAITSKDWKSKWKTAVMNSLHKHAHS